MYQLSDTSWRRYLPYGSIPHFPEWEKAQPKPTKDEAVHVRSATVINMLVAALFPSILIYNKYEVLPTLRGDVTAEPVASPLQNDNHLQAIRMDQLKILRFDAKVLRPPRVFAFHLLSMLTSSLLALVQNFGEFILCKPRLTHVSCDEITFSNEGQLRLVIGAKATLPSGQVTSSSGSAKGDKELEKRLPVYTMMSLNENIRPAQQLMGERCLAAHALQTDNGAKPDAHPVSEGAGSKRRSMGSVAM